MMNILLIPLTSEQENTLITLVAAYCTSKGDRLDLIGSAGLDGFIKDLPFHTNAKNFARYLIRVLQRQGVLEGTKTPPLTPLLVEMRERLAGRSDDLRFIKEILELPPAYAVPPPLPIGINIHIPPWLIASIVILGVTLLVAAIMTIFESIQPMPPPTVTPMDGGFNVLVAGFGAIDANGNPITSKDALSVSKLFAERLEQAIETNLGDVATPPNVRYVEETAFQQTTDPEAWEKISVGLATSHNAQIIVYGVIEPSDKENLATFRPVFFANYPGFEREKMILAGTNAFGAPFKVPTPFDATIFAGADVTQLDIRPQALALLVMGLSYETKNNYNRAIIYYERAIALAGWHEKDQGKEIAYLLAGNALSQSVARETTNHALFEDISTKAEQYFFKSLEVNPNYGRAMIGLHGVHYSRAIFSFTRGDLPLGEEHLIQAEQWLDEALLPQNNIQGANLPTKAHYGRGQIHLVRFYASSRDISYLSLARNEFMEVIKTYEQSDDINKIRLRSYNSDAHARLGLILREEGKPQEAISEYTIAAETALPFYEAQYRCIAGTLLVSTGDKIAAQEMLERATSIINFNVFDPLSDCVALENTIHSTATVTLTLTVKPSMTPMSLPKRTITATATASPTITMVTNEETATATAISIPTEINPPPPPPALIGTSTPESTITLEPTTITSTTEIIPSETPTLSANPAPVPPQSTEIPIPTEIFEPPPGPPTRETSTPTFSVPQLTFIPIPTEIADPPGPNPTVSPEGPTPEPTGMPIPTEIFPPPTVAPLPRCGTVPCLTKYYRGTIRVK